MATKAKRKNLTPSFVPVPQAGRRENDLPKAVRDELVEGCMNLCRKVAAAAAAFCPGGDRENLEGDAFLACVEAARVWQPDGSAKFSTFAQTYIQKKLLGEAAEQRHHNLPFLGDDAGSIPDAEAEDPAEAVAGPSEDDVDLLAKLTEPARSAVRMVTFEGFTPEQAACQLGMSTKDLKLTLRNSAKELIRAKAKDATPSMFPKPAGAS